MAETVSSAKQGVWGLTFNFRENDEHFILDRKPAARFYGISCILP
jgi:hypothetical protein